MLGIQPYDGQGLSEGAHSLVVWKHASPRVHAGGGQPSWGWRQESGQQDEKVEEKSGPYG